MIALRFMARSSRSPPYCEARTVSKRSRYGVGAASDRSHWIPRRTTRLAIVQRPAQMDEGCGDMRFDFIDTDPETDPDPVVGQIVEAV